MWRLITALVAGLGILWSVGTVHGGEVSERRAAELKRTAELKHQFKRRVGVRAELERRAVGVVWLTQGPAYGSDGWGHAGGWGYPLYAGSPYHPYFGFHGVH